VRRSLLGRVSQTRWLSNEAPRPYVGLYGFRPLHTLPRDAGQDRSAEDRKRVGGIGAGGFGGRWMANAGESRCTAAEDKLRR